MNRILITGGAGFVGSHTASLLLENGYDLIIIDSFVNTSKVFLKKICTLFKNIDEKYEERLKFIECDIRDINSLDNAVMKIKNLSKSIDILINNAGVWGASVADDGMEKTLEDYEKIVGTNLKGEFLFGRAVIPVMIDQGTGGDIINVIFPLHSNYISPHKPDSRSYFECEPSQNPLGFWVFPQ